MLGLLGSLVVCLAGQLPSTLASGDATQGVTGGESIRQEPAARVTAKARAIAALVRPDPDWDEGLFHPELFRELSPARVRAIFIDAHASAGRATDVVLLTSSAPDEGRFEVQLERGRTSQLSLRLEAEAPYRVTAFFLQPPVPVVGDFEALDERLSALPGTTSVRIAELTEDGPRTLYARQPEQRLGVASAFKLYVLGALIEDVGRNRRRLSEVQPLSAQRRSLSAGIAHSWPAGSPLTLHTLATLMIAHSDNTATDHLIGALGRRRVEEIFETMGHGDPARNEPLLMTRELFLLRGARGGALAEPYTALAPDERRSYLADALAGLTLRDVDPARVSSPQLSDRVEWFASAGDLCRALDWLRRATEAPATAHGRALLALNHGPAGAGSIGTRSTGTIPSGAAAPGLDFLGYKGGLTGGVESHAWLARTRDDRWIAVAAIWNDTRTARADDFAGLAACALQLGLTPPHDENDDEHDNSDTTPGG